MGLDNLLNEIDNVPPDSSVMSALKEKETKLKTKALETRSKAEAIVAEARVKAAKIREDARRRGIERGRKLISKGLASAQDQANKLETDVDRQIKEVEERAVANFDSAVKMVVEIVAGRQRQARSRV